ncbi:hypothetical protein GCM10010398_44780 [Streptomyces fimbriatus]
MLPVNPGSSNATPFSSAPAAGGTSTTANSPREVRSRWAREWWGGTAAGVEWLVTGGG